MGVSQTLARSRMLCPGALLLVVLTLSAPTLTLAQTKSDSSEDFTSATTSECENMALFDQDPEDAGLIDNQSYASPLYDYEIEWSADWQVDTYYNDPANSCAGPAVSSDPDTEIDTFFLVWTDDDKAAYTQLSGITCRCDGPQDFVDTWTSEEMIAEQWGDDNLEVIVLDDDVSGDSGAVLFSVYDSDGDTQLYTMHQYTELPDGTVFRIKFSSPEDWAVDSYTSLAADIEFDGDPLPLVLTPDDIETAIDGH